MNHTIFAPTIFHHDRNPYQQTFALNLASLLVGIYIISFTGLLTAYDVAVIIIIAAKCSLKDFLVLDHLNKKYIKLNRNQNMG